MRTRWAVWTSFGRSCWNCRSEAEAVPNAFGRDAQGRYVVGHHLSRPTELKRGNFASATTLQRTDRWPPELEALRAEVGQFVEASLVDEGDASDAPARRRALLDDRARLHRRIVQLDALLELRGLVDRRNKLEATAGDKWFPLHTAGVSGSNPLAPTT